MPRRVVVLAHEASHSGAPLVLLDFLRWLQSRRPGEFELVLIFQRGGELLQDFSRLAPAQVLHRLDPHGSLIENFLSRRLVDRRLILRSRLRRVVASLRLTPDDVVYANTAMVGWMLPAIARSGAKVLVHVHERAASIQRFSNAKDFAALVAGAVHFVAVSETVQEDLEQLAPAATERITVVRNWLLDRPSSSTQPADTRPALLAEMGLPPDTSLVGGVGHLDPIKGPDLFIAMAAALVRSGGGRNIAFAWLGNVTSRSYANTLRSQARDAGVGERVFFLGARRDPRPFLGACDVVTVSSRSEGASLVLLEAAQAGVPTVVFAGSGGPLEFARGGCAGIAPDHDPTAMAGIIEGWRRMPDSARAVVDAAAKKLARDHDRDQQCGRLSERLLSRVRS